MKNILSIVSLLIISLFTQQAKAQDVNEIVAKHIEAIGGKDNWSKVKSMKQEMVMKAQGAEVKITTRSIHNVGMRVDIALMGMNGYQILTTKAGWNFMPFQGQTKPEPLTVDDVKNRQDDLSIIDDFLTYKDQGKKIELLGSDEIDGTDCHKISLTGKDDQVTTYFIDKSDNHIIKETTKMQANGKALEVSVTYNNYKKLDNGIVVNMFQGGDMGDMEITNVEINPIIDEAIFKPSEPTTSK